MVFHGVNINWGVLTNIQNAMGLFQTREHGYRANKELITDGGETPVSAVYWGDHEEATFMYVASNLTPGGGFSPVYSPTVGDWVSINDTNYPAIVGYWLVDDVTVNSSNVNATRVTLKLTRYPYIDWTYG